MKDGFTLIELVALIVVIAMIALLTFPSILKTINQAEQKNYEEFLTTIELATEVYINKYPDVFPWGFNAAGSIVLQDLIEDGLYDSKTVNPQTGDTVDGRDMINIKMNGWDLQVTYDAFKE